MGGVSTVRDELWTLDSLKPHPRNYNVHGERQAASLADAMRITAFTAPIICKPDGTILGGHLRRLALLKLRAESYPEPQGVGAGWKIPCRVVECSAVDELRILATDNPDPKQVEFDNQALASLLTELQGQDTLGGTWYDEARLDELIAEIGADGEAGSGSGLLPGTDPDEVPDDAPTRCKAGDLWQLGRHRILCGDSTRREDVERLLGGAVPNLMITDPPYGVNYDPGWRNEAAENGALAYAASRIGEVYNDDRVSWREAWELFPGNVVYCWHAGVHASSLQADLETVGFEIRSQIIWAKSHFPISRGHYHWRHEPCWYAVRESATAEWIGDRKQTTLWEINLDQNVDGGHSTQKPVECMRRGMANHAGDVYDPFLGSGTTLIAAEMTGRTCYGMEISPKYCDVILSRWEKATGHTAEKVEPDASAP